MSVLCGVSELQSTEPDRFVTAHDVQILCVYDHSNMLRKIKIYITVLYLMYDRFFIFFLHERMLQDIRHTFHGHLIGFPMAFSWLPH